MEEGTLRASRAPRPGSAVGEVGSYEENYSPLA